MHFIRSILRNIYHNKFFSLINILGLAIGLSCAILIMLYLKDELTYDRHHLNHARAYRLESDFTISDQNQRVAKSPFPFGPAFLREFPEVEAFTRFREIDRISFKYNDKTFFSDRAFYADSSVFDIFTHRFIYGTAENALVGPNTIVLTRSFSERLFGNSDPVGNFLTLGNGMRCMVTGVVEDPPRNSHVRFEALVSMVSYAGIIGDQMYSDLNTKHFWAIRLYTYVLLKENASMESLIDKFPAFYDKYMADFGRQLNGSFRLLATPIADIHLKSKLGWDFQVGNMTNVYIFALIAFFILLIAAINYMNLATARSSLKAKEVGIRKVIGASRANLVRLFLAESVIQAFIALLLALLLVELFLPLINDISRKELELSFRGNGPFILLILGITFMVGLIAGSYPAFYLSGFMPARIFKEKVNTSRKSSLLRKAMITFQFAVSIAMISAIMVITRQVNYMNGADPGFNKDNVLVTHVTDSLLLRQMGPFKQELLRNPDILAASNSLTQPGLGMYMDVMMVDGIGKKEEHLMNLMYVDENYIGLMEMQLIQGRNFDKAYATDPDQAVIINQALAEKFGWGETAIGEKIYTGYQHPKEYKVVGVLKDFHFISLHQQIGPMVLFLSRQANPYLSIRIGGQNKEETIAFIEKKWGQFSAGTPYNYTYLDYLMEEQYDGEKNLQKLIGYFALISVFISLLGIFGLSSFVTEQYNREISIRKVFGASVLSIIYKLSWEFIQLVIIAFLLAFPIGWFSMQIWLENFDYHVSLRVLWFIASGLAVLAIAQLTVLFQSFNAARKSPLGVLKYE